tara:strand:+ start:20047 stop:20895 length:849 start_codon:yes stop_codon:yes gene_type:complete
MSISSSAVLVEVNISVWPASKIDREVTDRVNSDAGAVHGASQTKKNLFAGTSLRANIEKLAARVRLYHNQNTLPWADKGERLLPTKLFMDYKQTMNGYERTFNLLCEEFFDEYPRLVTEAPNALKGLYKAEDYPDLTEVRNKFGFRRSVKPLPEAGDFRLDIPAHDMEEMKVAYESQYSEKLADAMRTPWERLHGVLLGMSKKLEDSGDKKQRYHDSLITNPLELCELLTKLNITNDPKLEDARRQVELAMLGANIEEVKDSPVVREDLKSKVDAILGKFEW